MSPRIFSSHLFLQNLPFPSIAIDLSEASRHKDDTLSLVQQVVDSLEFDCSGYYLVFGTEGQECLNNSRLLREAMAPFVGRHIGELFDSYWAQDSKDNTFSRNERQDLCQKDLFSRDNGIFDFFKEPTGEDMQMFFTALKEGFRSTAGMMETKVWDVAHAEDQDFLHIANWLRERNCLANFKNASSEGRAALLTLNYLMVKQKDQHFSLSSIHSGSYLSANSFTRSGKADSFIAAVYDMQKMLLGSSNLTYQETVWYLSPFGSWYDRCSLIKDQSMLTKSCEGEEDYDRCCRLNMQKEILSAYGAVLKLLKYSVPDVSLSYQTGSDREDFDKSLEIMRGRGYNAKIDLDLSGFSFQPVIVGCKFGTATRGWNVECVHFKRSFSTSGLAYVFNSVLDQILSHNKWTDMFLDEMVLQKISERSIDNKSIPLKPKFSGSKFSLSLLLQISTSQRIVLQNPYSVPDLTGGEVIEIIPGFHTTVLISPTQMHMSKEATAMPRGQKECMSPHESDSLDLFESYDNKNCLFECSIKRAREECGCILWDFPRWEGTTPVCSTGEYACFREAVESTEPSDCPRCMPDSEGVTYSHTLQVKPMDLHLKSRVCEDFNYGDPILRSAIKNVMAQHTAKGRRKAAGSINWSKECQEFFQTKAAAVTFYVAPSMATRITKMPRVTFVGQLANLGMFSNVP